MSWLKSVLSPGAAEAEMPRKTLEGLFETMRESVIVVGEDTQILVSNGAAYDAFGRRNGPLGEKRLTEVIRDLRVNELFKQAIENDQVGEVEYVPVGTDRKYDVRVAPYVLEGRRVAVGIFYDVSEIERLQNIRQEFLSNISHELRTPLTSILAFVETLEDGAIDDAENNLRFLGVIRRNAERMHHLIKDILELSSIESGKIRIEAREIALAAAVDEVFLNLSGKAIEKEVELKNDVPRDFRILADAVRLEQMITNLVDNAIKFNREGGSVIVSIKSVSGFDHLAVTDTGEGIAPDHLQRIFERFYRTDRARSREIGGTGLGLAIVKHLARLHGGEVAVVSTVGKGTTFTIELPSVTTRE